MTMRAALLALLSVLAPDADAVDFAGGSKLSLSADYTYTDARVTGSNPTASFLTVGRRFQQNSSMLFTTKTGDLNWEAAADGRIADDDRAEVRKGSLKRAYIKAYTERHELVAGDFMASFTERTVGRGLKGGQYTWRPRPTTDFVAFAGMEKNAWDTLWIHDPSEQLDRRVYGARIAQRLPREARLGLNAVWTRDNRAHLDTTTTAQNQRVFSADWALPEFWGFAFYGESAYSRTDNDIPGLDGNGDPTLSYDSKHGWDHYGHGDFKFKRFKTSNDVERVDADYATAVGAASPDQFRVYSKNTLDLFGPWKWILLNYTYFHNNISHTDDGVTSTTRMPESGLRYDGPDWRPTFSMEVKLRHREYQQSDDARRNRTRSVIAGVADTFGPLSLSVDYEYQHEDGSRGDYSRRHHILGVGATFSKQSASGWKLTQALHCDMQRDRDNLIPATDQSTLYNGTLFLESPWGLEANAAASRSRVLPAQNPASDRRTFSAGMAYNLLKNKDRRVEVRYRQNDNRFATPDLDYKEMIWEASASLRL